MTPYWRWVLQGVVCAALTSLLVVVPSVNTLMDGTGYWAVGASISSLDATAGGSLRALMDRALGTVFGGFLGWCFLALFSLNGLYTRTLWCRFLLVAWSFCWVYPWALVRQGNPGHPLVSTLGAYTGYLVVATGYSKNTAFSTAAFRTAAICAGVLVTAVVSNTLFPRRARTAVREGLQQTLKMMAEMLDPVLELAAGLQPAKTAEYFNPVKATVTNVARRKARLHVRLQKLRAKRKKAAGAAVAATGIRTPQSANRGSFASAAGSPAASNSAVLLRGASSLDVTATAPGPVARPSGPLSLLESAAGATLRFTRQLSSRLGLEKQSSSSGATQQTACPPPSDSLVAVVEPKLSAETLQVLPFSSLRYTTPGGNAARAPTNEPLASATSRNSSAFSRLFGDEENLLRSDASGVSNSSRATALFGEVESRLEGERQKAIAQLADAMKRLLDEEDLQRRQTWERTMQRFESCALHLAAQTGLLRDAKREVLFCDRTGVIFPHKRYKAAGDQIQALFDHIAGLFFALDSQISQIATARRSSLMALPLQSNLAAVRRTSKNNARLETLFAGVAAASRHTEAFGNVLSAIIRHFRGAFVAVSVALDQRHFTNAAVAEVDKAAAGIDVLLALRNQRRRLWSDIFSRGVEEQYKKDRGAGGGPANDPELLAAWETLIGLDPATFSSLSEEEHAEFWRTYWISRDKLSVVVSSLLVLRDNLYVLCDTIDAIVGGVVDP